MKSKYKILKYISKNPNCSYKEVAKKLFNNDIEIASIELVRLKEFLNGTGIYDTNFKSYAIKTIDNISINSLGKEYLDEKLKTKYRFAIPTIISIISLLVSIISFFFHPF